MIKTAQNVLNINNRKKFRLWLEKHANKEPECWVVVKKGKPTKDETLFYLDAVEEALCFGWIDSTHRVINGKRMQRFSPRNKNSNWTELNKERVKRLEKLGLMTDLGRESFPDDIKNFEFDLEIVDELKKAKVWNKFKKFPILYQRIRISNIVFYKKRNLETYNNMIIHLIQETKKEKMFGNWNDYGRLLNY